MMLTRLHESVAAVCPIDGISGSQGSVRVDYRPEATQPQRDAADAAVLAFDWTQAAHDLWLERKAQTSVIRTLAKRLAANVSSIVTTPGDVTGLTFQLGPNKHYAFEFHGAYTAAAGTTGLRIAVNGPASPDLIRVLPQVNESATASRVSAAGAYDTPVLAVNSGGNTALPFHVWGNISTGAAGGAFTLRFASEVASSQVTILAGSYALLHCLG